MDDNGLGKFILDKLEKIDDKLDQVRIENAEGRESFNAHEVKDETRHQDLKDMNSNIIAQLGTQDKQLTEYNSQLKEHMRRTDLLEESQGNMQDKLTPLVKEAEATAAVKTYFSEKWAKRIKVLSAISLTLGIIVAIMKFI